MCAVAEIQILEVTEEKLVPLFERLQPQVHADDYEYLQFVLRKFQSVLQALEHKTHSLERLRRMLFGPSTEKTKEVLKGLEDPAAPADDKAQGEKSSGKKRKGHGRNGVDQYPGAERIPVPHPSLSPGSPCPHCQNGKVYLQDPGKIIRFVASPPILGKIYEPERLRCHLCGDIVTAELPPEAGEEKYDETVGSMIALLKYGSGVPFYRLEQLQEACGVPFPTSNQWEMVEPIADEANRVLQALIEEAAQGNVIHNDDTKMIILELLKTAEGEDQSDAASPAGAPGGAAGDAARHAADAAGVADSANAAGGADSAGAAGGADSADAAGGADSAGAAGGADSADAAGGADSADAAGVADSADAAGAADATDTSKADAKKRTGVFTSGIVSETDGHQIALYFTGREHAGECLEKVLRHRDSEADPVIQMCDALSRNVPKEFKTILANCLAHGRRQFVDIAPSFPAACRFVLESLCDVYRNDAKTKEQGRSPEERLAFHQAHSRPIMDALEEWMETQFEQKLVEPNSGLGKALNYMLNHWEPLTLFLRKAGAPLDNNLCERALKKAILHRKNALFYKTENGARVGDLFMSLIQTCRLNDANPFDYLTELQKNADQAAENPRQWFPWNYKDTLQALGRAPQAEDTS